MPTTQSPAEVADATVRRRVRVPAVGLYLVSLTATATAVIGTAGMMLPVLVGRKPWFGELEGFTTTISIVGPLLAGKHAVAAIGAWEMSRLRSYWWAVAGAVAALIPSDPFAVVFGLPLGLWALVALSDSQVKAAFSTRNSGE
jgi:hypothetical protein